MYNSKRKEYLKGTIFVILCLLSSCTSCKRNACFKNCTNDTLFIGSSHYDNIDSIDNQLDPIYYKPANANLDTTDISLWNKRRIKDVYDIIRDYEAHKDWYIYPDSSCLIDYYYLFDFDNVDTCYFFLIKWRDAKVYSWDEIRAHKLYYRWIVTRNKEYEYNTNIKYSK